MASEISLGTLSDTGSGLRLSGTSSGLDTEAIITAIHDATMIPAVRLETKITTNEAKIAAYREMEDLLGTLKSAVDGLRNPPGFLGAEDNIFENKEAFLVSSTTTNPLELVGVTVANSAASGSFELTVNQLATANKLAADPVADLGQTLGDAWNGGGAFAGTIEIGTAGNSASITIDDTMTISDLRSAINGVKSQTGVTASILKVSDTEYQLMLTADTTGEAITVTDATGIAGGFNTTEIQAAKPALFEIDGVAITRKSNQLDDVLEGMTFNLYKADPATTMTVSVEPSLVEVKERLASFVEAYNAFRSFVDTQSSIGESGELGEESVLFGDRTMASMVQDLGRIAGDAVAGLDSGMLSTLRSVGIEMGADNKLKIDDSVLDNALLTRLDEVRGVFEFSFTASSNDLAVFDRTNALTDTDFTIDIVDADNDGVPESVTIDGVAAEIDGATISGMAGTPYEGLELIWAGTGSTSIDVKATQGIADRLYNYLDETLDTFNGAIAAEIDTINTLNSDYENQIERIERRADDERDRLIMRFTAMEAALSMANSMLEQIQAQIGAMNGDS